MSFFSVHMRNLIFNRDLKVLFNRVSDQKLIFELSRWIPTKSRFLMWTEKKTLKLPDFFKFEISTKKRFRSHESTSFTAISRLISNHPVLSCIDDDCNSLELFWTNRKCHFIIETIRSIFSHKNKFLKYRSIGIDWSRYQSLICFLLVRIQNNPTKDLESEQNEFESRFGCKLRSGLTWMMA